MHNPPSHTHITFKSQSPQVTKIDLTLGSKRPSFAIHSSTLWKKQMSFLRHGKETQQLNADKPHNHKRRKLWSYPTRLSPLPSHSVPLLISMKVCLDLWRFLIGDIKRPEKGWSYQESQHFCLQNGRHILILLGHFLCVLNSLPHAIKQIAC